MSSIKKLEETYETEEMLSNDEVCVCVSPVSSGLCLIWFCS